MSELSSRNRTRGVAYRSQDIINIARILGETFRKLVVLFRERPNVDTTQRVRLRKR